MAASARFLGYSVAAAPTADRGRKRCREAANTYKIALADLGLGEFVGVPEE